MGLTKGRKYPQIGITTRAQQGEDFYKRIGAMGGSKGRKDGTVKGFDANRELARVAGRLGGLKSRRNKKVSE